MNTCSRKSVQRNAGYALVMTLMTVGLGAVILGSLLEYSGTEIRQTRLQNDSTRAYFIAQAGLEAAKAAFINTNGLMTATDSFAKYYWYDDPGTTVDEKAAPNKFNFFSGSLSAMTSHSLSYSGYTVTLPNNVSFQGGTYDVTIEDRHGHSDDLTNLYAIGDVKLVATGTYNGTTRTIRETVRYKQEASKVFDYAYFINNLGWMYGSTIYIDGDVRSNGNFNYAYSPTVNGYTTSAVGNGTTGVVNGTSIANSLTTYYTAKSTRSRPGSPADPTNPGSSNYSPGYDGVAGDSDSTTTSYRQYQDPLTMPYIGTVDAYEQLATDKGGYIEYWDSSVSAYTRIDRVFGDDEAAATVQSKGTYAKYYSPNNGKGAALYISGDSAHPIRLHGPFVVRGDVVIKGVYTGQGTIVAKRNVLVAGDLTSADPPVYPSTDATPYTTYGTNKNKPMLGLVARGSIVSGNTTGSPHFASYAKPPFTSQYQVESRDSDNGYETSTSSGTSYFNGNYTVQDKNWDGTAGTKSDGTARKFYESTLADGDLSGVWGSSHTIAQIDAVMYCNHLIGGDIGAATFNGTVVGRDEAYVFVSNAHFHYDERIHSNHGENVLDIFLPKDLSRPIRMAWREGGY